MTTDEFILQVQEKDITPETIKVGLDSLISDATKQVHSSYDNIMREIGAPKPDGVRTAEHIANTFKSVLDKANSYEGKVNELTGKVTELSSKAPDIEKIQAEWSEKLRLQSEQFEQERNNWKAQTTKQSIVSIANGFKFDESMQDRAKALAGYEVDQLLGKFQVSEQDGKMVLQSGGVTAYDAKGNVQTVESYLAERLNPFLAVEKASNTTPTKPNQQQAQTFTNPRDVLAFARENNIDTTSVEGQAQLRAILQNKK